MSKLEKLAVLVILLALALMPTTIASRAAAGIARIAHSIAATQEITP